MLQDQVCTFNTNESEIHLMPSSNGIQGTDTNISCFSKEKQLKHLPIQTEIRFKRPRPFIQDTRNSLRTLFKNKKKIVSQQLRSQATQNKSGYSLPRILGHQKLNPKTWSLN
jgi:hypothetical protein